MLKKDTCKNATGLYNVLKEQNQATAQWPYTIIRHRQPLSLKDIGSPNHSSQHFLSWTALKAPSKFRSRWHKTSSIHLLGWWPWWSFPGVEPSRAIFGSQFGGMHATCPRHSAWHFLIMHSSCNLMKEPSQVRTSTFVMWSWHLMFSRQR